MSRPWAPVEPPAHTPLHDATLARRADHVMEPMPSQTIELIERRLGGSDALARLGASEFVADHDRVSFRLNKPNSQGVRTVVITLEAQDLFRMDCYGQRSPGCLSAPLVASAEDIIAENLATVLGHLTGIELIHHRHF